ncbi:MAG: phosphatidylserine decarboxylase [Alphaproteobacteria bacterium]|nr:phosphatidylserine decarboxylase [Alphaproteobacteria bacterium]
MAEQPGYLESLTRHFVPVNSEGHKFLAIGAVVTLLVFLVSSVLGLVAAIATFYVGYFFRDPDRVTQLREGLVIAAADGEVAEIEEVLPPAELDLKGGKRFRVVTHLSPFDVHINRAPVAGRISQSVYVPGAFLNPTTDKESEDNERRATVITTPDETEFVVVQIAGMISRRIVSFVHEGDNVGTGQRIGIIRFGSRVDVYLMPGAIPRVSVGQRMVAGETVIADLKSTEPQREARRN